MKRKTSIDLLSGLIDDDVFHPYASTYFLSILPNPSAVANLLPWRIRELGEFTCGSILVTALGQSSSYRV